MFRNIGNRQKGFTLIELAIVLTIAGLLFAGLWRLLSGGNQQVRDQSAAAEQQQLISAVRGWLLDTTPATGGAAFLQALGNTPATQTANIPLPAVAAACNAGQLCNYLPTGFNVNTVNSYGQIYNIRALKDNTPAGTPPNTYSFMIVTSVGDTIPDTSGGRVAAAIGNDGGFLYTNPVCTAANANKAACGAYGTWSIPDITGAGPTSYGFAGALAVGGHIASRTYSTPSANTYPWLARPVMPNDVPNYIWNTMQTDLFMGGTSTAGGSAGNIYMFPPAGSPSIGSATNGSIFMAGPGVTTGGGTINLEGGTITGQGTSNMALTGAGNTTYLVNVTNGCTITSTDAAGNVTASAPAGCTYSINTDNAHATGFMWANGFYSTTYTYTGSDIRFKTDIQPLAGALDDLMKLKPVSYTLRASGKKSMGLIAQDLEKVYPQLVSPGDGMKYVGYDGLIAPLIGAVQELKGENDRLRQQLHDQEKRQNDLEKKIESITHGKAME